MALAGVEPRQLDIQVTRDTLLIKADTPHTHPETKGIVHVCEFSARAAVSCDKACCADRSGGRQSGVPDGLLRVTAAIAPQVQAKKVDVQAA